MRIELKTMERRMSSGGDGGGVFYCLGGGEYSRSAKHLWEYIDESLTNLQNILDTDGPVDFNR